MGKYINTNLGILKEVKSVILSMRTAVGIRVPDAALSVVNLHETIEIKNLLTEQNTLLTELINVMKGNIVATKEPITVVEDKESETQEPEQEDYSKYLDK